MYKCIEKKIDDFSLEYLNDLFRIKLLFRYRRHVYELNKLKTTSGIVSQFSVYSVLYCHTLTSPHVPLSLYLPFST